MGLVDVQRGERKDSSKTFLPTHFVLLIRQGMSHPLHITGQSHLHSLRNNSSHLSGTCVIKERSHSEQPIAEEGELK